MGRPMTYLRKIILVCPNGYDARLGTMVADFVRDHVVFVAVVGMDCEKIEDIIDEIVVGLQVFHDIKCDILTSSHPGETLEEVKEFSRRLTGELAGETEVVVL